MSRALDVVTLTGAEYDDLLYDAERYRFLRRKFAIVGGGDGAEFHALNLPRPTYIAPDPAAELDAAIDASVCRQCGHDNDAHDRQYGCAEDGCDCLTPNAEITGGSLLRKIERLEKQIQLLESMRSERCTSDALFECRANSFVSSFAS